MKSRLLLAFVAPLALAACVVPMQVVEQKDADVAACLGELDQTLDQTLQLQQNLDAICGEGTDFTQCLDQQLKAQDNLKQCRAQLRAKPRKKPVSKLLAEREAELRLRLEADITNQSAEVVLDGSRLSVRVLDSILFDSGEAGIRPSGQAVLDRLAPVLIAGEEFVRVEGHTDDIPVGPRLNTRYYSNWELSAARASAVVRYFQNRHGMPPERLEAVGRAQYFPAAPGDTPEGRQRNRRVEIVLTAAEE